MKQELVQLAKDKGFVATFVHDKPFIYSSKERLRWLFWMTELQDWLRRNNTIVDIFSMSVGTCDKIGYRFTWVVTNWNLGDNINVCDESPLGLLTYEEASETGLFEALKLLKDVE